MVIPYSLTTKKSRWFGDVGWDRACYYQTKRLVFTIGDFMKLKLHASIKKRTCRFPLLMADVNGLKLINDSFGYRMGDTLLKKVAEIMTKACRDKDIISRLGGDEFAILLPQTDSLTTAEIIGRIKEYALAEKIGYVDLNMSFGYATKHKMEENMQEIFKMAEDNMHSHKLYESSSMRSKTIKLIMQTLYEKSQREMLHSQRVANICEAFATKLEFDRDDINQIRTAGLMHDIGKMGIDEKILNKATSLNEHEWKEMKKHSEIGYRILSSTNEYAEIADFVLEHEERWDGKGYPRQLKGEEISLQARIIAIADAYDAITSDRAYRKGLNKVDAIVEIERCAGTQFDPALVKVFIEKVLKRNDRWSVKTAKYNLQLEHN